MTAYFHTSNSVVVPIDDVGALIGMEEQINGPVEMGLEEWVAITVETRDARANKRLDDPERCGRCRRRHTVGQPGPVGNLVAGANSEVVRGGGREASDRCDVDCTGEPRSRRIAELYCVRVVPSEHVQWKRRVADVVQTRLSCSAIVARCGPSETHSAVASSGDRKIRDR